MTMPLIENYVARVEQAINPIDRIPFIGSFSGIIRIIAGAVEIVAAAAFAYLKATYVLLTKWGTIGKALKEGGIYALHGLANILRGTVAMLPGANLVLLVVYDYKLGRLNYPQEKLRLEVYPLWPPKRVLLT